MCIQTTALISFHMFEFIREILLQVMFPLSGMLFPNTYITLMMLPLSGNSIPDTYITLVMFSYKEMLFSDAYIILMMLPLFGMLSPGAYITLMMLPLSGMLSPDACNTLSLLLKSNYSRKNLPDDLIQNMSRIILYPFKFVFMASDSSLHIYYLLFLHIKTGTGILFTVVLDPSNSDRLAHCKYEHIYQPVSQVKRGCFLCHSVPSQGLCHA